MFFVSDNQVDRHRQIREYLTNEAATVAVILSAIDFEWSVRRTILALGYSPTKYIRDVVLNRVAGPKQYKEAWNAEVSNQVGKSLPQVIPHWDALIDKNHGSFILRNRIVHGIQGAVTLSYASERVNNFLKASKLLEDLALLNNQSIYKRIVRYKSNNRKPSR